MLKINEWKDEFVKRGGLIHLINIIIELDISNIKSNLCFSSVWLLLETLQELRIYINKNVKEESWIPVISKLIDIMFLNI